MKASTFLEIILFEILVAMEIIRSASQEDLF